MRTAYRPFGYEFRAVLKSLNTAYHTEGGFSSSVSFMFISIIHVLNFDKQTNHILLGGGTGGSVRGCGVIEG